VRQELNCGTAAGALSTGFRRSDGPHAARAPPGKRKLQQGYRKLLNATSRVVGQAKRFSREVAAGVKKSPDVFKQAALDGLRKELDTMAPRVRQVMQQARARVLGGDTHVAEKLVSIFEPGTEIIRKGNASKPTEFGKMVKIQEAENQIITSYEVYEKRLSDSALLIPAIESHEEQLGRVPRLVAGDAAFYSPGNEKTAHEKGVKRVCVPNRNTKSAERKREQKKRWFREGQKWRPGLEGRISVVKRRHGLNRSGTRAIAACNAGTWAEGPSRQARLPTLQLIIYRP
jgi:transposase, IS5 family